MKLDWNHPKWFPCCCPKCGWEGMSNETVGGTSSDAGDYDDIVCPDCAKEGSWIAVQGIPEPNKIYELWTLLPSYREAAVKYGDRVRDFQPSAFDVISEAVGVFSETQNYPELKLPLRKVEHWRLPLGCLTKEEWIKHIDKCFGDVDDAAAPERMMVVRNTGTFPLWCLVYERTDQL